MFKICHILQIFAILAAPKYNVLSQIYMGVTRPWRRDRISAYNGALREMLLFVDIAITSLVTA